MALKFKKPAPVEAHTTVTTSQKGVQVAEETNVEQVEIPPAAAANTGSDKPFCEVGFDASYTMNLGDYNSTRIGVSLKIPCLHPEIDEVFEYGKGWVNSKMETLISEIKGE
ncbi:hypothetical protein [Hyphomicrobium sp.]|uniref:hypothetical protein n=1 Tax=Hyphomicrobium sp. TaxID=82 RepID=UPI001DE98F1F|nr:hypothetical protein [Hyphomicrobium sp.]MBY0560034.1 hypothetical protein [Hyphomicrobium sp.]